MNDIKAIVKKSGTSFFWSMRMLPKAKREAMYTIYAFCRHIDDIVDGDSDMSEKQELLRPGAKNWTIFTTRRFPLPKSAAVFIKTVCVSNCRKKNS